MFNDASLITIYSISTSNALGKDFYGTETAINATILVIKIGLNRNFAIASIPNSDELFFTSYHISVGNPKWTKVSIAS